MERKISISELWTWHTQLKGVKNGALVAIFESGIEVHSMGMHRICPFRKDPE